MESFWKKSRQRNRVLKENLTRIANCERGGKNLRGEERERPSKGSSAVGRNHESRKVSRNSVKGRWKQKVRAANQG